MNYKDISTGSTECVCICTKYNIFAILMINAYMNASVIRFLDFYEDSKCPYKTT